MNSSRRHLPPRRDVPVPANAELFAAGRGRAVHGNGPHDEISNEAGCRRDDLVRDCYCRTVKCRCSARTGLFAAQCSACFKWRLVPSKRAYEDIRQAFVEDPFVCEKARRWNPYISCDVPDDIQPNGDLIWGIDDPTEAPQPPPEWVRILRIRNQWWDYRFADVYVSCPFASCLLYIYIYNYAVREFLSHFWIIFIVFVYVSLIYPLGS